MKKYILLGSLILITACQNIPQTPQAESTPTVALPTQPEPATATVTFTSAPTLTATPVPLYFTDDFNAADTTAWTSFQTGGETLPTLRIENGLLRFDLSSPDSWYYAIHSSHDYEDVNVAAKFDGPPSGSTGLICRYSESGWYEFNISSDGTYNVLFGQLLGEGIANYLPIASDPTEYLTPGLMDYEIGLICQENFLSLFINGKLFRKLDVTRFALSEGKAGVSTASFKDVPAIVTLDWFKVSAPE
jgi:hypothetical protein